MLIVEDEALVAAELAIHLDRLGLAVVGMATDGQTAVEAALRLRPDLVLMDVQLGGRIDGIEAASRIRERAELPIVFVTAHVDAETARRARDVLPVAFLPKPFTETTLRLMVDVSLYVAEAERARREAVAKWRRSESTLAALMLTSSDGILAIGEDDAVIAANARAAALLGWNGEEILGKPVRDLLPEAVAAEVTRARSAPSAEGPRAALYAALDGTPTEIQLQRAELPEGPAVVVSIRDVSERVRLEQALREAQKRELVGRLANSIAHDFNNLLTVVMNSADLVLEPRMAGKREALVSDILAAADRGAALVRKLLLFGRPATGQKQTVDAGAAVLRFAPLLRRLMPADIRLTAKVPPFPTLVLLDPSHLDQVVLNLVVNARDALPGGGEIGLAVDAEGGRVRIRVSDTGTGMAADVAGHVFEPFFTTKGVHGTGLGLSNVSSIVTEAGGEVRFHTRPGSGTVFEIDLPQVVGDAPAAARPEPTAPAPGQGTVLVVDDDPLVLGAAVRALESGGFDVLAASSASAALQYLEAAGPAIRLVVTDLVLPVFGGLDLIDVVRRRFPDTRVAVISGVAGEVPGGVPVLRKPFDPRVLKSFVQGVLSARA